MAATKSLAPVKDAPLPAAYDYGDDAGAGFENMGREDFATPFMYVLQPNSPIVTEDDNARPGMLMNTISKELWKAESAKTKGDDVHAGVAFIPCYRTHKMIEWKPRDEGGGGGGFVAEFEPGGPEEAWAKQNCEFGDWKTKNGNDLIETFYVYGFVLKADGTWDQLVIPFTSTKIKVYKQWMTRLKMIRVNGKNPPIFAHRWRLTTQRHQNDSGVFYNFVVNLDGEDAAAARISPQEPIFQELKDFYELCRDGIAKPNYESAVNSGASSGGAEDGEEVPF